MTIVIDVRWIDRMSNWLHIHDYDFKRFIFLIVLFSSPLVFGFAILALIDYLDFFAFDNPLSFVSTEIFFKNPMLIAFALAGGACGTIVLVWNLIVYFQKLNNEHKWFALKRYKS